MFINRPLRCWNSCKLKNVRYFSLLLLFDWTLICPIGLIGSDHLNNWHHKILKSNYKMKILKTFSVGQFCMKLPGLNTYQQMTLMLTWVLAIIRKEGGSNGIQHECLFSFLYVCIITTWKIYYLWHVIHNLFKPTIYKAKAYWFFCSLFIKLKNVQLNMYVLHKSR